MPKTDLEIFPLSNRVAIRPAKSDDKHGSIIIPEGAKEKPVRGMVIAVGPGKWEDGKLTPMNYRYGDIVIYGKYSGTEVEHDGETLMLIKDEDIIAKIEGK